jgi:hypothetical protein
VLNEFFTDITLTNDQTRSVHFYKVLSDDFETSDAASSHVYKVLSDTVTLSDATELLFDVGIYDTEEDTTSVVDSFDRVVQYVRLFNDTFYTSHTTAVDFGKTLVEDPVWVTRDFWANPDYSGTEFAWNVEETIQVAFDKNVSDSYSSSDNIDTISFGKVIADTANTTAGRPGFVINKVLSETIFASDAKSITTALPTLADSLVVSEDSIINNLLSKTEIATTLDYYNKVLQISRADDTETSEIIFIEDEIPHIDMVGVNESSRMIINKGIGDMLGISDSGIINTQDYVDGDFGSDFVGQATYF